MSWLDPNPENQKIRRQIEKETGAPLPKPEPSEDNGLSTAAAVVITIILGLLVGVFGWYLF